MFQYVSIYTRINSIISRDDNKCLHGHHEWINGSRKIHCKDPAITRFNGLSGYGSAIYWEMLVHTTLIVSCLMLKLVPGRHGSEREGIPEAGGDHGIASGCDGCESPAGPGRCVPRLKASSHQEVQEGSLQRTALGNRCDFMLRAICESYVISSSNSFHLCEI